MPVRAKPISDNTKPTVYHDQPFIDYARKLSDTLRVRKHLLLIQTPQFPIDAIDSEVARNRGYYAYPPTGLQWLAQVAMAEGFGAEILDLNLLFLEHINSNGHPGPKAYHELLDHHLKQVVPCIVGVTCLSVWSDFFAAPHPLTDLLVYLMETSKHLVVAGGTAVNNDIHGFLSRGLCHFILAGEGEDRLRYLLNIITRKPGATLAQKGIFFWNGNKIRQSRGAQKNVILAGNLVPSYEMVAVEKYSKLGSLNPYSRMAGRDRPYGLFQLSRGCRSRCAFCGVRRFMGKGVRTYPVDEVITEITYLVEQKGLRHFEVLDDDLLAAETDLKTLLKALIRLRAKHPLSWAANNGLVAASLNAELLELIRASGCIGFQIGIESGDSRMLSRMRKPGTIETFKRAAKLIARFPELFVGGNYIIGLFGEETFGQMCRTFHLSQALRLDWGSFALFQDTRQCDPFEDVPAPKRQGGSNFIPAKNRPGGEMAPRPDLPLGPAVFDLPRDHIPGQDLLNTIWLTFNMAGNYINNKNLKPGGNPAKFTAWLDAVSVAYPKNPYMPLFAGLGRVLMDDPDGAQKGHSRCRDLLETSPGWRHKFDRLGILSLAESFPRTVSEAHRHLEDIRRQYFLTD